MYLLDLRNLFLNNKRTTIKYEYILFLDLSIRLCNDSFIILVFYK